VTYRTKPMNCNVTKTLLLIALALGSIPAAVRAQNPTELRNEMDSVSYAIGRNIGQTLMKDSFAINPDLVAAGARDAMNGAGIITDEEMTKIFEAFQVRMMAKMEERMARQQDSLNEVGQIAREKGDLFLARNGKRKGVVVMPSGLQYEVLRKGTGKRPLASDMVKVSYTGTLIDGTEFDSSMESEGQAATFNVEEVISGWAEALQLMKVGSKWRIYLPSDLGYGINPPPGGTLGPGATLIYEIELLAIVRE
jgi:FKBP-type peptidyl-prolyl cis-trans isomerase